MRVVLHASCLLLMLILYLCVVTYGMCANVAQAGVTEQSSLRVEEEELCLCVSASCCSALLLCAMCGVFLCAR